MITTLLSRLEAVRERQKIGGEDKIKTVGVVFHRTFMLQFQQVFEGKQDLGHVLDTVPEIHHLKLNYIIPPFHFVFHFFPGIIFTGVLV